MPWRTRTARPISHRFHEADPDGRPPMKFVARRIPAGEKFYDRPLWKHVKLPPFDKKTLVVLASTCDAWEARLPEETEVSAFVLNFFAWPDDIEIRLSDDKMHGAINRCFSVVALTRHTASAVWGGSEKNGFEQLADDIYACREVRAAPDIDALHSLTPQAQELR
ncbi:hypothetical protein ABID82_001605 [Methylobacterium sp. PvP062]|jgi:hypothetical protein|uniref:Uncharacterized protein n=2 Tax=Methylobacterium TaxID=407 RepID=A0A509E9H8_9HYPH|nr:MULTISPECIES: hypothetical protein [Methylobacterium]MCY4508564.1 hypothetical protein [Acidobacteriota bacterium]GAN46097.1 primosomal protein N' [Methylobacterium sp. ME121]MBN6818393.1 hypothetical protein [Methylobacterium organophilum]MBP2492809.1 hypothetical protein [Methylobacterium sp. PvP105]MBP2500819.1 hypothetical protein [Methylobacterium sp. PvP109]